MPEEFQFTTMEAAAVEDHEMYVSWIRAGFGPDQAFSLLLLTKRMGWEANMQEEQFKHMKGED